VRLSLREVEQLPALPFVVLAALIGVGIQSVGWFAQHTAVNSLETGVIWAVAATVLWWLSVRRRQYSAWMAALQITCVIGLTEIGSFALVTAHVMPANVHLDLLSVSQVEVVTQLELSPLRFVEAVLLVALGRFLPGSGRAKVVHHPEALREGADGPSPDELSS
jgi:hypothetical protein